MARIDLVYFQGCPNFEPALRELNAALEELGEKEEINVLNSEDPNTPSYARQYGSPSILVDEKDLFGVSPSENPSCRLYQCGGYPRKEDIIRRLSEQVAGGDATR